MSAFFETSLKPIIVNSYPAGISWNSPINSNRPLHTYIVEAGSQYSSRPAFDFLGKKFTWGEIYARSVHLAALLKDMDVSKGKHVGIMLPNCPLYLISFYAVLMTGATVVNYNPLYAERELENQINDSQTTIMITADLDMIFGKLTRIKNKTCLQNLLVARFSEMLPFPKNLLFSLFKSGEISSFDGFDYALDLNQKLRPYRSLALDTGLTGVDVKPEEDIAVLQYTGGTTGTPKAAMLTHANLYANVEQCALWFPDARPGQDKMLGVIPFFHIFAMSAVMNLSVKLGFEIIATPRFDLKQTLKLIHARKPQFFPAVPAIYTAINSSKESKNHDLTSLKYCISGGAPLPVEVKAQFEKMTGCTLVEGYGLTESSPVVCVNPLQGTNKPGSIGLPLPCTHIEIRDKDDKKTVLPLGEVGELCVKGPQVMKGYYNKTEETEAVLKDGWLYTADIAKIDEDGYVSIVDRIKDMIITNGYNVYPRNIEEAIYMHSSVEECIVAGIPDNNRGEIVKAWIKCKDGFELKSDALKNFLKDKLSPMEIPKIIEFRKTPLPKTLIGKLSRKDILEEENAEKNN